MKKTKTFALALSLALLAPTTLSLAEGDEKQAFEVHVMDDTYYSLESYKERLKEEANAIKDEEKREYYLESIDQYDDQENLERVYTSILQIQLGEYDDEVIVGPGGLGPEEDNEDDAFYIHVGKGEYTYIKAGLHNVSTLEDQLEDLEVAVKENRLKVESAQLLIDMTPKTIAPVRDKIDQLLEKSQKLVQRAEEAIKEYKDLLVID